MGMLLSASLQGRSPTMLTPLVQLRRSALEIVIAMVMPKYQTFNTAKTLTSPTIFNHRFYSQLGQSALETVVPKEVGAAVLVVEGPLRGNRARVQAKMAEACAVSGSIVWLQ